MSKGQVYYIFLSTLSLRRATFKPNKSRIRNRFLSTLSLRRATILPHLPMAAFGYFYPRSPCGERRNSLRLIPIILHFYPRSPCGERRGTFRSTHNTSWYFYPRSPCGERHEITYQREIHQYFYPRSPCGERHLALAHRAVNVHFYPRSPCGERPMQIVIIVVDAVISIHALLAESDIISKANRCTTIPFLSTLSLRRATPSALQESYLLPSFLSTLSLRRATFLQLFKACCFHISIHALLAESDGQSSGAGIGKQVISIHALLAESDLGRGAAV